MYVVSGALEPEVGLLLMRGLEAASDQIFRVEGPPAEMESEEESRRAAAQRRADAVGLLAERALAAGFGRRPDIATEDQADHDDTDGVPVSGCRAERYQVVLHVDAQTLSADGEPDRSEFDDGTRVSAETSRRLSCDAGVVRMGHGPDGAILDVGRRTRTIPPALRRALEARDRGCRFPGCGLRFTDGHHVKHWADGGETSLGNCLLLCHYHHRLVHEGRWRVAWWGEGRPVFIDPRGGEHYDGRWKPPATGSRPVETLIAENRSRRVDPDGWTASGRWRREGDVPDEVLFGAMEALG